MSTDANSASWTGERVDYLLDAILEEIKTYGRPNYGAGFKPVAWQRITDTFNEIAGVNYDKQQLQYQCSLGIPVFSFRF